MSQKDEERALPAGSSTPPDSAVSPKVPRFHELGGPTRLLLPLALAAIVIFGMRYAAGILTPLFVALFLTMGMSPALYWLRRKGVATWLTVVIVLVVVVILGLIFIGVLASMIIQVQDKLPVYKTNLIQVQQDVSAWFAQRNIDIGGLTSGSLSGDKIFNYASSILGSMLSSMKNVFLMVLIVLFMVSEVYAIPRRMTENSGMSETFRRAFANFSDVTRSYLFTKAWMGAIVAVFVTAVYYLFGVDFALFWGLIFFVLSFIPNIGFVLSVIPPFFVTLLEFGFVRALIVVLLVIVVNGIVDNVLAPRIMGRSVGLSSLTVLISVFFWGWVFGGIGALISVPLTLMVKLLFFDSFESTQGISAIMATPVIGAKSGRRRRGRRGIRAR